MLNQLSVAERAISLFNDVVKNDPTLAKELFKQEWRCNTWVDDQSDIMTPGTGVVRFLGILNGLVGTKPDGQPFIRGIYDDKGKDIIKLELNV